MKMYNSIGPNPRMVRMFMAEKGFEVPKVEVDLRGGENRREPYLKVNPSGQSPALELDDGTVLAEITAICEYVDEKKKDTPSLIGDTPEERAKTRMWTRRIDLNIVEPAANGFRFAEGLNRSGFSCPVLRIFGGRGRGKGFHLLAWRSAPLRRPAGPRGRYHRTAGDN